METNLYSCIRTGRTISEKTMEDGNLTNSRDDIISTSTLASLYSERPAKLTTNGHDFIGEPSTPRSDISEHRRTNTDDSHDDKHRKRINPLRIHLGKRPFVDNSHQYYISSKKKKSFVSKNSDTSASTASPRVPKLIPKRFQNVTSHIETSVIDSEKDKPVPRLVPKSQLQQYKKAKIEKVPLLKEYAQSLGLQPMVKFKCRKCCSMSFKTLAMLKEHQLICRAQTKEPALSPELARNVIGSNSNCSGPSRVTRKVYLCSACGTYYENWNLFLHMREIHNRHICLFCLGMFSKAEKLSTHLTNKHNVTEYHYNSKEEFLNYYNGTLYLMCCACDDICSEQDDFFNHDCNNVKPKPVPLLVSKSAVKTTTVKNNPYAELPANGPTVVKDLSKSVNNKKDINSDTLSSQTIRPTMDIKSGIPINSETSMSPKHSAASIKDMNNAEDSGMELESLDSRMASSPLPWSAHSSESTKNTFPNGDENLNITEDNYLHICDSLTKTKSLTSKPDEIIPPVEKECGIKLKLSLNKAKSPVIINSTVDPSVGLQIYHKPPSRSRKPPKRYEKVTSDASAKSRAPSIKMTICDRADSPFVKTTFYENNKETVVKTILNNNVDSDIKPEPKVENAVKTTIYDNKPEDDINTLNRVPKLTVRVPKELLDKDSSSDYSSDSEISDKLTMDENMSLENKLESKMEITSTPNTPEETKQKVEEIKEEIPSDIEINKIVEDQLEAKLEPKIDEIDVDSYIIPEPKVEEPAIPVTALALNRPIDKYPMRELLKVFLASTIYNCIYCNHVRKIAVNCEQLTLHMIAEHRFSATVDSITAEELMPETIAAKLKAGAEELNSVYINLDSYDSVEKIDNVQYEHIFECFPCYFKTSVHKDLYLHNRKLHQKTILLCVMCKSNFYSYSELLCHLCPGTNDSEYVVKFRCCFCSVDSIPSQFRLMVHLRKVHHTCDVCLEFCHNQARLTNHVWKHKLNHLCYRCNIAYRNKQDITNHLFWKHGTESVLCKRCMHKKWPHVYHFCSPPAIFVCEECNLQFTRAVYLKVHKRFHSNVYPHSCPEEDCTEKFVSKKLLSKHIEGHKRKLVSEELNEIKPMVAEQKEAPKETIAVIDLVNEKSAEDENASSVVSNEVGSEQKVKKIKKKKNKDKDALLLDVNLPALNLSESDSSDESDSGLPPSTKDSQEESIKEDDQVKPSSNEVIDSHDLPSVKQEDKPETNEEEKANEQQVLDIWNNFQKYQAKVEKQKTPPLVSIKKHVCESDHDYCLIPADVNGDDDLYSLDKKKNKKSPKKHRSGGLSSSSSSSSDSDSSCSCGSNCSCSSSSGSSSSSSSDSDSSDVSGTEKKKVKRNKRTLPDRRISTGSNVDVMGMSETPILVPEKVEPPIAETDLETDESETDEEFYDENPQQFANKLQEEKRIQLLASANPSEVGSFSRETSRPVTPIKAEEPIKEEVVAEPEVTIKATSSKKKSKKKKKSRNSKKHAPIKINIPKDVITKSEPENLQPPLPNKITISLQSNTVQMPDVPKVMSLESETPAISNTISPATTSVEKKRASKRRRVPNKFYGYSSDEERSSQAIPTALKPQQPPKLEWRKEDLPSPVTHRTKKEVPPATLTYKICNYADSMNSLRLTAPIPDPEPPKILMNSESVDSDESDSSDEGNLEIDQPTYQPAPIPPPTYLNSGTSSLPYPFQRPAVREAREGESVYCYCRCPYDEVSEMIACDAEGCPIEWFHFECVGIMVPPKGKWYCPECRKNQSFSGYR